MSRRVPVTGASAIKRLAKQGFLKSTRNTVILAYLYVVIPKIIKKIRTNATKKTYDNIAPDVAKTMIRALHPSKFPLTMGRMIVLMNLLNPTVGKLLRARNILSRVVSVTISAFISSLVNYPSFQRHILRYGRSHSLDFTLILLIRALDSVISSSASQLLGPVSNKFLGDELLFIISSALIMQAWAIDPSKLPPSYLKWISSAAKMDTEVLNFFRGFNAGKIKYGEHCEDENRIKNFCAKYNRDPEMGDVVKGIPVPCEIYHGFSSPNCEINALIRFWRGFKFAGKLYGTINLLAWLVRRGNPKIYIINTLRSAAFLSTFITLMWYGFCVVKGKIPRVFPQVSPTFWEILAPRIGAYATGLSCFVESGSRRKELSLFVAPKALGTLVPLSDSQLGLHVENLVFSISFAILVALAKENPLKVRGLMGKALQVIFA